MSIRIVTVGFTVFMTITSASAQDLPPRLAAVDGAGGVVPVDRLGIDAAAGAATAALPPCAASAPLAPSDAQALVMRIAEEEKFNPDLVRSVAKNESHFDSTALSDKGAFGLMQLMPETAQRFDVDLCDPADNVRGGVRFLRVLHERYKNPLFVAAAYNAGEEAVARSRGIPPYPETVRFVAKVINDLYGWPQPADRSGRDGAPRADVVEPAPGKSQTQTTASQPAVARWSDGFVMHID
ncbi:lytic transglycosylase domain-containing protein [Rhodopseudomonas parapalustris]